jgi:hypothetical protein
MRTFRRASQQLRSYFGKQLVPIGTGAPNLYYTERLQCYATEIPENHYMSGDIGQSQIRGLQTNNNSIEQSIICPEDAALAATF